MNTLLNRFLAKKRFGTGWLLFVTALFLIAAMGITPVIAEQYSYSPATGSLTSPFGWRTDPMTGRQRFHAGIDIGAPQGDPIYVPQMGEVVYAGSYGGYGNMILIHHGQGLHTLYGHTSEILVSPGQVVQRGQIIGKVGSTGRSTGPHLHFEVHLGSNYINPIEYLSYLNQIASTSQQHGVLMQPVRQGWSDASGYRHSTVEAHGHSVSGEPVVSQAATAYPATSTVKTIAQQKLTTARQSAKRSTPRRLARHRVHFLQGTHHELVSF